MALSPGTRIGAYEIGGSLGAGGMGEVYRATDTNLKRQVAIKVLPDAVAADGERLARFQREAEVLASLNHPNIAGIYGIEAGPAEAGHYVRALVMELVEGPTLADRISEGAIPVDDALLIARQIADALEAAHEQGIIHRDLKPANIKVRPDGTVKVLDFGLAKAMESGSGIGDRGSASLSPTLTSPAMMTGVGMILGTAAYMSPEQARGRAVDRRADIWAFGVVLFEMLTGRRAFEDEDVSLTLSKVLQREPDFEALPPSVPARVSQVLRLCLRKDVKQRAGDIRDVRLALEGAFETVVPQAAAPSDTSPRGRIARVSVAALLGGAAIAATATWFAMRPDDPVPPRVSRLPLSPSATAALTLDATNRDLAMAPDGSRFAYVGNRGTQIFVRALDALEPVAVFTGSPRAPFFSPDGQWIGFVEADTLKKVAVTGGPAVTVGMLDGQPRGATWGPDETIIFATGLRTTGLQRVLAGGGKIEVLTRPDRAQGEGDHLWPEMLPGGRAVLFTIVQPAGLDTAQVVVLDLQTRTRKVLVRGGSHARYVPSGHLVYGVAGTLRAVSFDLATLEARGTAVPVVPDVVVKGSGGVDAAMADDGTLAYVQGAAAGGDADRTLVWVDRSGREVPLDLPAGRYFDPRLSPDGSRIAIAAEAAGNLDVWVIDIADGRRRRITFSPAADRYPLWTPDGKTLVFMSARDGLPAIYRKGLEADLAEEKIFGDPTRTLVPWSWSADAQTLVMSEVANTGSSGYDVGALTLSGKPVWKSLLGTAFLEATPVVSPDGKWMAYSSNEGGGVQGVYVRPFPDVTAGVEQVSTEGGNNPVWPRDGRELLYRNGDAILSVPVELSPTFRPRTPEVLFMGTYFDEVGTQWDATRDGKRLLMLKPVASDDAQVRQNQIVVVQNWFEELKRLVPVN